VDGEVQAVAAPSFVNVGRATRNMIAKLVEIASDAAPSFFAAELMRQVDVDRSLHG